ncbi:MAG: DUF4404 family protein [Gammaproteobacteria bacterium]
MSQEDLHQLLSALRREINNLDANSDAHKEINALISDIELQLKLQEVSLVENIQKYIGRLEAEHPKITNILSDIMAKLTNIGI